MMPKILIIGSTGKLGSKLLKFSSKNNIKIDAICCFNNKKKLFMQGRNYKISNKFVLSDPKNKDQLLKYIKSRNIDIVYFLDFGSQSIKYLSHFLYYQSNSLIAVANKELIIAGGKLLMSYISKKKCIFIPLDSEHYSLLNSNFTNSNVEKIFITASGGPFYFKKKVNLNTVKISSVLNHPKWKMGINNLIDSSNFINKVLEIFELCFIYNIDIKKVDFLLSKEAFVHSVIKYKDGMTQLNCFNNDMIITLIKPLQFFYNLDLNLKTNKLFKVENFKIEKFLDSRFPIKKHLRFLKKLNHTQIIQFMVLNNFAQTLYLSNNLNYNSIVDFIVQKIKKINNNANLNNLDKVLHYINELNSMLKKEYNV